MYSMWIAVHALTFWRNFRVCFSLIILNNIHNSTCTRACVQQQKNAKITLIFYKCTTIRVDPTPKMCVACLKMLISLSLSNWSLFELWFSHFCREFFPKTFARCCDFCRARRRLMVPLFVCLLLQTEFE